MGAEGITHQTEDDLEDRVLIDEANVGLLWVDVDIYILRWDGEEEEVMGLCTCGDEVLVG